MRNDFTDKTVENVLKRKFSKKLKKGGSLDGKAFKSSYNQVFTKYPILSVRHPT